MADFFKTYGTLLLAIYGVVQVWIIALWKKYLIKAEIAIYETGNIEIGYGTFGPTIGLNGTLRVLNTSVFVRSIDLLVIRNKDKAQHNFKWTAFRPSKINVAGSQQLSMEIPSGFLISPDSPYRFNIVFNDNNLMEEIRPLYNEYISEWNKVVQELNKILEPTFGAVPTQPIIDKQRNKIDDFNKSKIHVDSFSELDRKCYWEPGDYALVINVKTSKPENIFSEKYDFSLNQADAKNLKLNVVTMLNEPIANYTRTSNFQYNFAYASYKKDASQN